MRDGVLVGAVVVHHPDFFGTRAVADEINFALGDAGDSTAQAEDDFVGKLVGDYADCVRGGVIVVLLAENLGRGGAALDVVEPALDGHFVGTDAKVAEGQHGRVWRRRIPVFGI